LAILGYHPKSDKIIQRIFRKYEEDSLKLCGMVDKRGLAARANAMIYGEARRMLVRQHIITFEPSMTHNRHEHCPNMKYHSKKITTTFPVKHFKEKNPEVEIGPNMYREELKKQHVSLKCHLLMNVIPAHTYQLKSVPDQPLNLR